MWENVPLFTSNVKQYLSVNFDKIVGKHVTIRTVEKLPTKNNTSVVKLLVTLDRNYDKEEILYRNRETLQITHCDCNLENESMKVYTYSQHIVNFC